MNRRAKCYIVHQPMRIDDRTGRWKPAVNLSPAGEYGDLVFMLDTPERPPLDPEASLPTLRAKLADYRPEDYIVLAGDMNLVAYACVIAARVTGGLLNLLRWDPTERRYISLSSSVHGDLDTPSQCIVAAE